MWSRQTCTCSIVKPPSNIIPAGQAVPFEFSYRVPNSAGDDRQTVTLGFEAPGDPTVALTVRARRRLPLTIQPPQLSFGQVAAGTRERRTLRIENYSEASWDSVLIENL